MKELRLSVPASEEEWLALRKNRIGGSEVATLFGFGFGSLFDLWASKRGIADAIKVNEAMEWGNRFEDAIAEKYKEREGCSFRELPRRAQIIDSECPDLVATPDRLVADKDVGLEVKNVGGRAASLEMDGRPLWGEEYTDEVPPGYVFQCQAYLACTGFDSWDLAVVLGGQEFRVYRILPDKELHAMIRDRVRKFMELVRSGNPPPDLTVAEQAEYLRVTYRKSNGRFINVDQKIEGHLVLLENALARLQAAEEELEKFKNLVKADIGENDGLEWIEDGKRLRVSWRQAKPSEEIDYKALAATLPPEQVRKFKITKPGQRRFLVPRAWSKEKGENE